MTDNSLLIKERIAFLEKRQRQQIVLLKEQSIITFESLKPMSFLKDTINDFTSQSNLKDDVFDGIAGVTTGFLSKKLIFGTTKNPIKKLAGTLFQVGITALVAKKSSKIKVIGEVFLKHIFNHEAAIIVEE